MPEPLGPFAVQANEGVPLVTPSDDAITIKVDTAGSHGSMTLMELEVAAGSGPPQHIHEREDELWWVLEGEFRFKVEDEFFTAGPGGMAFGPRRAVHAFQNLGATSGRLLIVTAPAGVERFFEQFAQLTRPVEWEDLVAVGKANWLDFVGPPLSVSDPL